MIWLAAFLLLQQDPEALSSKALELAKQQRTEEAEKLWKQALVLKPDLFSAAFNLGYLHFSRNDCASAEPLLSKAASINSKDFNASYLAGVCLSQLGRIEDAFVSCGVGARVRVGTQHDHATTSVGYASSSAAELHFGLGTSERVGDVEIVWPSGAVQVLRDVATNQVLRVREPGPGAPPRSASR